MLSHFSAITTTLNWTTCRCNFYANNPNNKLRVYSPFPVSTIIWIIIIIVTIVRYWWTSAHHYPLFVHVWEMDAYYTDPCVWLCLLASFAFEAPVPFQFCQTSTIYPSICFSPSPLKKTTVLMTSAWMIMMAFKCWDLFIWPTSKWWTVFKSRGWLPKSWWFFSFDCQTRDFLDRGWLFWGYTVSFKMLPER